MADSTITGLPAASSVSGTDLIPIVQSGVNRKATISQLPGGGGSGDVVGPASSTDSVPALFDGTTGKLLKNSTPTGTGNPVLQTSPTLTTPRFADLGFIADQNGNEMLAFNSNASAVNYFELENGATGNPPHIRSRGDDANIGLHLVAKGTGLVSVCDSTDETKRLRFQTSGNSTGVVTTLASVDTTAGTKTLPTGTTTLVGTDSTQTLTNKTLTSPILTNPEIGATDTTLGRSAAGIINVEGEVLNGYASTATAAGTTTLTVASARVQHFTGTTTQTVVLPTTSVVVGQQYEIVNRSTGLVTVQSSGLNTIVTLGLNQKATVTALQAAPTTAAHWSYEETNLQGNSQGKRLLTVTQSATPSINTNNGDIIQITGLAQAITSMSSGLTGNPVAGDMMMIQITDNGTARAITWGASYASTANATLPTTTVANTMLRILFQRNNANTIWDCISVT